MLSWVNQPHRLVSGVHRKPDSLTGSRRGEKGGYEWLQIDGLEFVKTPNLSIIGSLH